MSIVLIVLLPITYLLLQYFCVILNRNKKLASIPTLPGRLLIFGHVFEVLKTSRCIKLGISNAIWTLLESVSNGDTNGVLALYIGPIPFISITSPEALEIVTKAEQDRNINYNLMNTFTGIYGNILPTLRFGSEYKYHRKIIFPSRRQSTYNLPEKISKHFHRFTEAIGEDGIIDDLHSSSKGFVDAFRSEYLTKIPMSWETRFERWKDFEIPLFGTPRGWLRTILTPLEICFPDQVRRRREVLERIIEEECAKLDAEDDQPTLLSILIREHLKNPEKFTSEDVKDEFRSEWTASVYTIALTLTFLLHELGHRPDIQDKIREELKDDLSPGQELTLDDLDRLPYLEAVVKECIRRHPAFPSIPPWITRADIEVPTDNGVITIPRLSVVVINSKTINHNPRHWKNPEEFNPDRFLDEEEESSRHPLAFYSFSSGNRTCPGKKIALLTLQIILAQIIQRFTIESLTPLGSISLNYSAPFAVVPVETVPVRLTKRNS